ncbi:MAG: NAD(P)/FAD-dependent oxidoreductase [Methanolinea sp.]|jgi:NAD(P)H-nitrite reductase large subunit|nr:NAD(P)/FAD-dependent oxidoreductase [Methanolinea sp.]
MTEDVPGAILQRDGTSYAIVPRTPSGVVKPEELERIAHVARKYRIPVIKMTSGQRMVLVGMKREEIPAIWKDLGMTVGQATAPCVHYVQACPGTETCKYGVQDSLGLGLEIERMYLELDLPAKVKIGVSGCPRCCGESYVRDIGIFGSRKGWTLLFGGNSAGRPRIGNLVARDLSREDAIDLTRRLLEYYRDHGKPRERTARFMERVGFEAIKSDVLRYAPYIRLDDIPPE